jgi:hypothetical protein
METLKEAAERFYPPTTTDLICSPKLVRDAFIAGGNHMAERMYSDEEVIELLNRREDCINQTSSILDYTSTKEWFEQFKKK